MNGSNFASTFIDESKYARTVNVMGSIYTDTDIKKYGTASGAFRLLTPNGGLMLGTSNDFVMSGNDFTIEAWVYNASLSGAGYQTLFTYGTIFEGAWSLTFFEGGYVGNGPYLVFAYQYIDNTNTFQQDAIVIDYSVFPVGNWRHVAVVRNGSTGRLFVNGVAQTDFLTELDTHDFSTRIINTPQTSPEMLIGFSKDFEADTAYIDNFYGRLDDVRITRGFARYTANFTPPTAQLPAS